MLIDLDDVCVGNPVFDLINHFSLHVLAAQTSPEAIEGSLGMTADQISQMYTPMIMGYLGTDDPSAVERHSQAMVLLVLFVVPLSLVKSRNSNKKTPRMVQGILQGILPMFRAMQPQIVRAIAAYR